MANAINYKDRVVEGLAVKIFEKAECMSEFPNSWRTAVVRGVITAKGAGRKWEARWTMGALTKSMEHRVKFFGFVGAPNMGGA